MSERPNEFRPRKFPRRGGLTQWTQAFTVVHLNANTFRPQLDPPMRTFLIDSDTASDDAVAIIMALSAPDVRVCALTTVAGNVGLEQATRNALYTAEVAGSEVPVFRGAAAPLVRRHEDAFWFHGRDGFGDRGYAPPRRAAAGSRSGFRWKYRPLRRDGRRPVLRGQRHARSRIQHLGRSGSGAARV